MAYNCFLPFLVGYCDSFRGPVDHHPAHEGPAILEIGVDRGQMMVPFISDLVARDISFRYDAIDVLYHDSLKVMLWGIDRDQARHQVRLFEGNSLNILPDLSRHTPLMHARAEESGQPMNSIVTGPYDIVLIDGDHNYGTVSNELQLLTSSGLTSTATLIIVDEYNTRWANENMYYHDRPGFEDANTTPPDTFELDSSDKKCGVRPAVDDFLSRRPEWRSPGEANPSGWCMLKCRFPIGATTMVGNNQMADAVLLYHEDHPQVDYFHEENADMQIFSYCNERSRRTKFELRKTRRLSKEEVDKISMTSPAIFTNMDLAENS